MWGDNKDYCERCGKRATLLNGMCRECKVKDSTDPFNFNPGYRWYKRIILNQK